MPFVANPCAASALRGPTDFYVARQSIRFVNMGGRPATVLRSEARGSRNLHTAEADNSAEIDNDTGLD